MADAKKILIVEDEKGMLDILADRIALEGFSVITATDGQMGLDKALSEHPDLILLDILMPRMDGITVAKWLRDDPWGKNIPIIILTNLGTPPEGLAILEKTSKIDYVVKADSRLEDVIVRIRELLNL